MDNTDREENQDLQNDRKTGNHKHARDMEAFAAEQESKRGPANDDIREDEVRVSRNGPYEHK